MTTESHIEKRAIESCILALDQKLVAKKDSTPSQEAEFDALLSMWLLQHAFSQLNTTGPIDINSDEAVNFIADAIIIAHDGWLYAVSFIQEHYDQNHYNVELDRFGLLIQLSCYADSKSDPKLNAVYRKALDKAIVVIGDKLTSDIQLAHEEATKELEDILDAADESLLQEFFKTFQEIGTFYRDPSRYDNDEDRKRHQKMMEIYNRIMNKPQ